ncbi:RHS repeat-associated core domain-containing protein [Pseudomonas amygdali]|nr:RHS repeat-associated core domain-containing protein [Pseudomonas amygdali]
MAVHVFRKIVIGVASLWLTTTAHAGIVNRTYTALGQVASVDGERDGVQDTTHYQYDDQGNLTAVIDPLGHVYALAEFDSYGNPQRLTDPNGVVTTLSYTPQGWLASRTVDASTTQYGYNEVGDLLQITTADGNWVKYTYDDARRLVGVRNRLGESINYTLDAMGNRTTERTKDSSGEVVRLQRRAFDELGRLIKVIGASDQTQRYGYDLNDNQTSDTTARNYKTQQAFDALNRVSKIVDPLRGATALGYNADDKITKVIDPRGVTTVYTYDGLGNRITSKSPDGGMSTFAYDEANNLIRSTDARGVVTQYSYDALNRLTSKSYPATPALNIKFLYDQTADGNLGIGHLTGLQDSAGVLTYTYDAKGNLVKQHRSVGVNRGDYYETVNYGYDAASNLVQVGYPSNIGLTYLRNSAAQVTGIKLAIGSKTVTLASNISYQPFGPVSSLTWGNGVLLSRAYDQDYRLTLQQVGNWQTTYRYDADSNVAELATNLWGAVQYEYDALGRLTQEQTNSIRKVYGYDPTGNRTQRTTSNLSSSDADEFQTLTYASNSNRLTSLNGSSLPTDAAGNHTQVDGRRFVYDSQGRLSEVYRANIYKIADYKYNVLGQRIIKRSFDMGSQAQIGTTSYLYDLSGKLIGQTSYDEKGQKTTAQYWFWLDNMPLAQLTANFSSLGEISGSKLIYLHPDHLDSPRLATDSTQNLLWRWNSDAYGLGSPEEDVDGDGKATSVPLRFLGQIYDAQSQLNYNYFRDYNPNIGRYAQSDPIGLNAGLNTYSYVGGNPVGTVDPYGLMGYPNGPSLPNEGGEGGRGPDFFQCALEVGQFSANATLARTGDMYFGWGVGRPYPGPGLGANAGMGWLNQAQMPTDSKVKDFAGGFGQGAAVFGGSFYGLGGGIAYSPGNGTATVIGIGTPGSGVGLGGYQWSVGNIGISW